MSQYIHDVAIYGVGLLAVGIGWEAVSALIERHKQMSLPFAKTQKKVNAASA